MSDSLQVPKLPLKVSRRRFNQLIALTAIGVLANETAFPEIAYAADNSAFLGSATKQERYHVFVGEKLAQAGGQQSITLKSGIIKTISIPKHSKEDTHITLKSAGLNGADVVVILHTLYDSRIDLDGVVEQAIVSVPLLKATRERCRDVYQQLKSGERVSDPQALDVLDTIIAGSSKVIKAKQSESIQQRYQLASQNSRLVELQTYIEDAVDKSEISPEQKQRLKGTYQYVRANEPLSNVADLDALTEIDAIIQGSALSIPLRQRYAFASAQTRAFTADEAIQNLIRSSHRAEGEADPYLKTYNRIRLGLNIKNQIILTSLNALINKSNLPPEVKTIYKLARDRFFDQNKQEVEQGLEKYLQVGQQAAETAASIVPTMTQVFAAGGVTAGTGTAISTLSGGAAINATLATLGGGSVAAGGLGMLGGLAVATGGAAFVGAAALVSVSVVAGMPPAELQKLGVAATAGTLASATVMGTAWAVASTFLIAESLTGAAAISATIAALGGVGIMTGGAALITFGVGLGVWQFLKNDDATLAKTLKQIEPTLYVISEAEKSSFPTLSILEEYLNPLKDAVYEAYLAPQIPLDKLSNTLSNYAFLGRNEKVLAMIDTSIWNSGKAGILFTDLGIWWNDVASRDFVDYSDPEYHFKIQELSSIVSQKEKAKVYELAERLDESHTL